MAGYATWHQCNTLAYVVPRHGAVWMMVSLRLKDELIAEIDRIASAHGQTRSAWIANVLSRAALSSENDNLPVAKSEEHTSELQSLMRISYAVFCLKKKKTQLSHTLTSILTNILF